MTIIYIYIYIIYICNTFTPQLDQREMPLHKCDIALVLEC